MLSLDPHWPPWCETCDWGLDPSPEERSEGRTERWWRARLNRASLREHDRLLQNGLRAGTTLETTVVLVLAALVHLVTLGLLVAAVALWLSRAWMPLRVVLGLLLLGMAWQLRPRLSEELPRGHLLTRDTGPELYALIDEVGRVLGARSPTAVVVDSQVNAFWGARGWRRRRVLGLGLPLWAALDGQGKVALLGHELGHEVAGDVRRLWLVSSAIDALGEWQGLLRPVRGSLAHGGGFETFLILMAELLAAIVLLPVVAVIGVVAAVLGSIGARSGQRAEHLADQLGAQVGGTEGALACEEALVAPDQLAFAVDVALRRDSQSSVWSTARDHLASMPDHERRRQLRLSAQTLQAVDATHPPTIRRMELLRAARPLPPRIVLDREREERIDAEVRTAEEHVRRLLTGGRTDEE